MSAEVASPSAGQGSEELTSRMTEVTVALGDLVVTPAEQDWRARLMRVAARVWDVVNLLQWELRWEYKHVKGEAHGRDEYRTHRVLRQKRRAVAQLRS